MNFRVANLRKLSLAILGVITPFVSVQATDFFGTIRNAGSEEVEIRVRDNAAGNEVLTTFSLDPGESKTFRCGDDNAAVLLEIKRPNTDSFSMIPGMLCSRDSDTAEDASHVLEVR